MGYRRLQVFGLGQCSLDYLGRIPLYPPPDGKCEFTDLTVQGGGPVATALVALSRWGFPCAFAGVVGDDPFGGLIRKSLAAEEIDLSGLLVREGAGSQFAFIAAETGGRRTIFWRRPTGPPPKAGEVSYPLLREARVFHTDGLFPEASLASAREARKAGIPVVVDGGTLREGMLELARLSDCFLVSESFARSLIGRDAPQEACRRLAELGPAVTAVTLGSKGCVALAGGRIIEQAAWPVEAIDTTGCGDVFHGGFIYGLLHRWATDRCLAFASWAAAMTSLRLGGRQGIPNAVEYPGSGV